MADLEKVIKALEDADVTDGVIKMSNQFRDVLVALLKEQGQTINELEEKLRLLEYGDQDILQSGMMPAT